MKKLFLVDGHSYIYRAYYAIKNLSTKKGQPTGAIYGFTTMLVKLVLDEKPDYIIVTFDSPTPSFRCDLYKEYKANRKKMPDDLISQIPIIKEMVTALNINYIELPGFEADDIIATIATSADKNGIEEIIVLSSDKDILQLVNERIFVQSDMNTAIKYNSDEVIKKFGVPPAAITDFLALCGDASDNVPGVPGIGPKTASNLIQKFITINNLLNTIDKITNPKTQALIEKHKSDILLSLELVKLKTDIPININFNDCKTKEFDYPKLNKLLFELEFRNLQEKLIPQTTTFNKIENYCIVDNDNIFDNLINDLNQTKQFAFHIEFSGEHILTSKIIGISFSFVGYESCYIPLGHYYLGVSNQLDAQNVLNKLKPILENPDIKKIGHDFKNEFIILSQYGIKLQGIEFDTMIASYIINSSRQNHKIEDLSMEYLGYKISTEQINDKKILTESIEINSFGDYSCKFCNTILKLKEIFSQKINDEKFEFVFYKIEMPLISILGLMEINGIKLNIKYIYELKTQIDVMLKKYEKDIFSAAGEEFNINSSQQLGKILFEKLKLPVRRKTKTGYSTDASVLTELSGHHELPLLVLNYRQLAKLNSTYVEALPHLVNSETGRLHTSFNQTITATGRLSSSNPNLQNIPIRSDFGKMVRKAFIAKSCDFKLLSGDYSQIELRVLAHFSQDKNLIQAFLNNEDIHTRTACELFDVTPDKIDTNFRRIAKTINFGIIYGMSPYGLAQDLKISQEDAIYYINSYFNKYAGVKIFIDTSLIEAKKNGFVTTFTGRKRYILELFSSNKSIREAGERMAINTIIQGSAADLIKIAMIKINNELQNKNFQTKMILQIHDELIFESPNDELEEASILIKNLMENAVSLTVPIKVDITKGESWFEL